jgi:hypothetical protein
MYDSNQRFSLRREALHRSIQGECVILQLETDEYHGLEGVGADFFALAIEGHPLGVITERLLALYEVEEGTLRRDIERLVTELVEARILEPS